MRQAQVPLLLGTARDLCAAASVGEAADVLAAAAREVVGAGGCHVFLVEADGVQSTANSRATDTARGALRLDPGERSVVSSCLEQGRALFIGDAATSDLVNPELRARFGAASLLAVPLGRLGGIVLWWPTRARPVAARTLLVVEALAAQAAAVLDRLGDTERLRGQTLVDPLTGLANRRALVARLETLPTGGTVVLVDLDHFKNINDVHGHRYGDGVLCRFADLLAPLAGDDGCVARYGGEEFALVLPDLGPDDALELMHQAQQRWAGAETTFSAGVAPHRAGACTTETLEAADRALYEAKRAGRDRTLLAPETAWVSEVRTVTLPRLPRPRATSDAPGLTLELLDAALHRGLVEVRYQPVVRADSGEVVALEALARLRHPESGALLQPADFLPLAERTGRASLVDELVAEQAIAACASWRRSRPGRALSVGINVSVAHLDDPSLAPRLLALCADHGLEPNALVVEVTETLASERGRGHEATLQLLAGAGVNVTLDDFGTGFASLEYLLRFPVAGIKVDRSFTWALDTQRGVDVVTSILQVGRQLGLHVVAEGVETPAQLAVLRRLGCPFLQGYLISRPLPASAVPAVLEDAPPLALPA